MSRSGHERPRRADPCAFVIFDDSGDLTHRFLVSAPYHLASDSLLFDGDISHQFNATMPELHIRRQGADMNCMYKDYFIAELNTGYEMLIYDNMIGEQTLFQHAEHVEMGWRVVQPFVDDWRRNADGFDFYATGSDGPRAAIEFRVCDGRQWRPIELECTP